MTSKFAPRPTASQRLASFERQRTQLIGWLHGRNWDRAVAALYFAESYHTGIRKDGITPEFAHQISIASYLSSLTPHLDNPEDTLIVAFLHDVCEDYDVEFHEIDRRFGPTVTASVRALTKVHKGVKRNPDEVATTQANDPIASIVKPADRIHNQSTLVGVFSPAKIVEYVAETRTYIMPMLKNARRQFPSQFLAYQNSRAVLIAQMDMLDAISEAA